MEGEQDLLDGVHGFGPPGHLLDDRRALMDDLRLCRFYSYLLRYLKQARIQLKVPVLGEITGV
jgi:hypothetical protein